MIDIVAFDADDTLWHTEPLFVDVKGRFCELLSPYHPADWIAEHLYETETRNLKHFGYGIKSLALSMIETAVELTEGRIRGHEIQQLVEFAKEMLRAPIELLEGVEHTVRTVASRHTIMLVTKGDLFDQESKLARSGLGELFSNVEIVSAKDRATYEGIAARLGFAPARFVMVGDSLKSDILPVVEMGGHAIHVPYATTWEHEHVPPEIVDRYRFLRAQRIEDVPTMLEDLT